MSPQPRLPIIDVSDFDVDESRQERVTQSVNQALQESGFMYVVGHGLDPLLIAAAFAELRKFFAQPTEFKQRFAYTDVVSNFGYQGIEGERLNPQQLPDLKESFTMRNALGMAEQHSRWPDDGFRETSLRFYVAAFAAAHRLLRILTECLQLPDDFFRQRHRGENVTLRWLHYPANLPARSAEQLGAGAHTDYGSITLLFQDSVGGLELLGSDGAWHEAPPVSDAIVINTGDLMERWTNGRFRSTVHRVRPVAGLRDRYSIALFVDPDSSVEVECIASCASESNPVRYSPITAAEHLRQKIAATH
ncbi:MAG: isopenicillin N synthase family dioxygenase [Povalibacter sp.]